MSRTVLGSMYKNVKEPIQQNSAVRYNSRLRWTAMKLRLRPTVATFRSSEVRRPFISQVQFDCCGCCLRAFSWMCWRPLRIRRIWYLSSWGRL